jgi:predicted RNA-binding protein with PIN domain/phage shock protein A
VSDQERLDGPLPEPVRHRVVALAAAALGDLPPDQVPTGLRPFARFAPHKRTRLAATPIAAALESDVSFRASVSERLRLGAPDLAAALDNGTPPPAADPLDVAAAAYVLRTPGWTEQVELARREIARTEEAARSTSSAEALSRAESQLAAARAAARAEAAQLRADLDATRTEVAALRRKLHDARQQARDAEQRSAEAEQAAAVAGADAATATAGAEAELRRLRGRLADAETALDAARRAAREGRSLEDTRLRLLLDTIVSSATGLRRELALPPVDTRPADTVAAVRPSAAGPADVASRALSEDDPELLDALLSLPQVHLVVDGYNVTKGGYGTLPLEAQRARLVTGLGALTAQTGCEVTCVFDGAALDRKPIAKPPRGVRVLFSPPDTTADELIRRLVRAEPPGRPVVVVSSDREVADGVSAAGARPVPAAALLKRLDRG